MGLDTNALQKIFSAPEFIEYLRKKYKPDPSTVRQTAKGPQYPIPSTEEINRLAQQHGVDKYRLSGFINGANISPILQNAFK
jgi:hypothetical protein